MQKLTLFSFMAVFLVLLITGCKKKTDDTPTPSTGIIGTWSVNKVSAEVSLAGLAQSDTDSNPSGTIAFLSNDTGATAYSFKLFSTPYGDAGAFKWSKDSDVITVTREDGTVEKWKVLSMTDNRLEAEFTRTLSSSVQGKLQVVLTK